MHRQPLLALLAQHIPHDDLERISLEHIIAFVMANPRCFDRNLAAGHITGAAWLLNRDGTRVLLTHHRKLNKWLQLGGHADGDPDVIDVALREAREESGIAAIEPISSSIFDVDVHEIPARGNVAKHLHYDIRFLCKTTSNERFTVSDESHDLAWVAWEELSTMDTDASVLRMHAKWGAWLQQARPPSLVERNV